MHDVQITCAAITQDGKLLVSGGLDSVRGLSRVYSVVLIIPLPQVVSVHKLQNDGKNGKLKFQHMKNLVDHQAPITCVAVSRAYSIVVSASCDGTCFIWDLNHLKFVRPLSLQDGPVHILSVNEITVSFTRKSSFWF